MKKLVSGFLTAALMAGSIIVATPAAQAGDGNIAAGVAGGLLGGALLGAAIANNRPVYAAPPPPPGYYAPAPAYVEPACRIQRERFWDGYGWRLRDVQVCN